MYIFIDESGSFTAASNVGAWCTIAAFVCPETDLPYVSKLVRRYRNQAGGTEVKLRHLQESDYFVFLHKLSQLRGICIVVAADLGMNTTLAIQAHQRGQVERAAEHKDKMLHPSGREAVQQLAEDLEALPAQLYAQLIFQVQLIHGVLATAPLYYAQRQPQTLGALRWRIDQKDVVPTAYEDVFRRLLPIVLQSISLEEPMLALKDGADYSHFKRFDFEPGKKPDYLKTAYGIETGEDGADLGKMIREDFALVDSDEHEGVQVADLIAGGVRRLLRGGFAQADIAARLLGANLVQAPLRGNCIRFFSLDRVGPVGEVEANAMRLADRAARRLLRPGSR